MNYGQANAIMQKQAAYANGTQAQDYQRGNILGSAMSHSAAGLRSEDVKIDQRAIPQAFNNLEKDLYSLGELVNALSNRLKPVSRPECPEVGAQEKQLSPDVPMVNVIAQADLMLRGQLRILGDILQRLEV